MLWGAFLLRFTIILCGTAAAAGAATKVALVPALMALALAGVFLLGGSVAVLPRALGDISTSNALALGAVDGPGSWLSRFLGS